MTDTEKTFSLVVDREALNEAFQTKVKEEVTKTISASLDTAKINEVLSKVFSRKAAQMWDFSSQKNTEGDNWLEQVVERAINSAFEKAMLDVVKDLDLYGVILNQARDFIASEQFVELMRQRTAQAISAFMSIPVKIPVVE